MVYIGTSGYSYDDWVGPFYPQGLRKGAFLQFYARRFGCVEVNSTYYRMPTAATLAAMSAKTGPEFSFVVKAPGEITHEGPAEPDVFSLFTRALQPLVDEGKLGCVLCQFPSRFRLCRANVDYIRALADHLQALPTVIELRHRGWVEDERTFDLLRGLNLGYCCVDEPAVGSNMPPLSLATSDIAYVRFHGRNAEKWFHHKQAWERYDYLYSAAELAEWVPKVRKLAEAAQTTYVFFNNHYNAQAVQNAGLFTDMLARDDAGE